MIKVCPRCKEEKPHSAYYSNKSRADGVQAYCILCCRAKAKVSGPKYYQKHREQIRASQLMSRRGVDMKDVPDECQVCGRANGRGKGVVVDHCHDTGQVRGFLCGNCNVAIGMTDNDSNLLRKLADYLEKV